MTLLSMLGIIAASTSIGVLTSITCLWIITRGK